MADQNSGLIGREIMDAELEKIFERYLTSHEMKLLKKMIAVEISDKPQKNRLDKLNSLLSEGL